MSDTNGNRCVLETRRLYARYGDEIVLEDINLKIQKGEIFVVIGESGCGKTTLLKHMAGLIKPSSGEVLLNGENITKMNEDELAEIQRTIGIAFQSGGLFNSMTVGENVALPLKEYGRVEKSLIDPIVRTKLSLVGLADAQHKMPEELSGGMRKRAGLARAIATDPPVVYFDEPSSGLDPIMASGLDDLILRINELMGSTFVIVTHEIESIRKIAGRVVMLHQRRVIFDGTVKEAETSEIERVRQFFERRADAFINSGNGDEGNE